MDPLIRFSTKSLGNALAISLFTVSSLSAATATYTTGTFTSNGVLDLLNAPPADVVAIGFAGSDIITDNGFTFTDFSTPPAAFTYNGTGTYNGFAITTTGDLNFDALLSSGSVNGGTSLTLNNLSIGTTYTTLFLYADDRSGIDGPRLATVGDGVGSISTTDNWVNPDGVPVIGTYVTATFVADATTQNFSLGGPGGPQLNALALSPMPIPEPSTFALLVAGMGGLAFVRLRKRNK